MTPPPPADPALQPEALAELHVAYEELSVAEEELRAQLDALAEGERGETAERRRYREVFDFVPDPLLVTDGEGLVQEANLASLALLGRQGAELRGKPLAALMALKSLGDFYVALAQVREGKGAELSVALRVGRSARVEVRLRAALTPDGSRILWSAREIDSESPPGSDRSDAWRRERQALVASLEAERASREAAEGRLGALQRAMAVLGHELRAPVNIVLGWAQLLRGDRLAASDRPGALAMIERHARAQVTLVNDLLDASALAADRTALRLEVTDLGALASDAVEAARPLAADKGLDLSCAAPRGLMVLGDHRRLTQVVTNLLANAIKFTPERGRVVVRCELARAEGARAARRVRLIVEDDGRGLESVEAESLFGFFRQGAEGVRHARSFGLGLYLVRQFISLHGGEVSAEASAWGGARFVVTLPTLAGALAEAP